MALVLKDRVKETTTSIGTGAVTLAGATTGFQSFAAVGNGNTTYYTIAGQTGNEWEVGVGTYTASGTTLSRDTILESSSGGSAVNFSAGTKDVFVTYPAERAVSTDTLAYPPAIGGTTPAAGTFTQVSVPTASGNSVFNENDTITGWLYSGRTFSIGAQEATPTGLFIGSAGTKMYVNGSTGDDVNEYTLGTAWDITTATFVTIFSTAAQDTAPQDVFFKPDGLSMYVVGDTNNTVYQYTLSTAWSIATASYASLSFSVNSQETTPTGLWFKPDGTVMYVVGSTADAVFQYALSTAWDVSTASYSGIFYSVAAQETAAQQVNLSNDGLKMWVLGATGDDIWEYDLGTAWNVSTATPVNNFYVGFQDLSPTGMFIDSTAPNRVYIVGGATDAVFQYDTEANSLKLDTSNLYVGGFLKADGNFVAGANAYVDGTFTAQGTSTLGTTNVGGALTSSSTTTLATSTAAQTIGLGAGATISGATKTINIGTAGVSGSTTNINIGSAVAGATTSTTFNGSVTAATFSGNATSATNIAGGAAGRIPYNTGVGTTAFVAAGTAGQILQSNGTSAPTFVNNTAASKGYAQAMSLVFGF